MLEQPFYQTGDLIAERYHVQSVLGQGGSGITYAVEDVHTHQQFAVKALSLRGIYDWKQLELFEREAKVLAQLEHPAIPRYIDYFQTDTAGNRWFYIVQALAPGTSLADLVQDGWQASQAEVRQLAVQILGILKYLHELTPPIIHRDIKPHNIIRNEDGQIYLVDFGAVQNVYRNTMVGSTVVGTYGYMAPEHFQGKAVPATDLYSLGATLLFLLTHCSPADLPHQRLKINFRKAVQLQPDFADWLDHMLEPAVEDRLNSAQEALAELTQPSPTRPKSLSQRKKEALRHQPKGSKIQLQRTPSQLTVDIPPSGLRGKTLGVGLSALFFEGIALVIAASVATSLFNGQVPPLFAFVAILPLLISGSGLLIAVLFGIAGSIQLQINPQTFQLCWQIQRLGLRHPISGSTAALDGVKLTTAYKSNDRPVAACTLIEGDKLYKFGTLLSLPEKEWLVREISDFLWCQPRQKQNT
ncbi:serine/threonine-protein kinase [Acaryochloris sp. CCMEE 5410]|uniref:serine/threonine protein kinase n=1 Tax=Acaryochloris sp. CCMEE 5410 TaxID=310037 RepID=UPI0002483E63|nr:serine/threonine protein kinase [Acaryochloris sp. CCMEE 5410]